MLDLTRVRFGLAESRVRVLVLDDDSATCSAVVEAFSGSPYEVTVAPDDTAALKILEKDASSSKTFDLFVSEICSPGCERVHLLEMVQGKAYAPAVILVGEPSIDTVLTALRIGVADYLLKPTEPSSIRASAMQVLARRRDYGHHSKVVGQIVEELTHLHTIARNERPDDVSSGEMASRFLKVGGLVIDTERHSIQWQGRPCPVTPTEYALLRYLAQTPSRTRSYSDIVRWTHGYTASDIEAKLLLKSHVRNLRRKIGSEVLINVKGGGYMLLDSSEQTTPHDRTIALATDDRP